VRNLLLTQAMIIAVFALALLIPRVIPWLAQLPLFNHVGLSIFALFIAAVFINLNLSRELIEKGSKPPAFAQQPAVLWLIVVPLILAAWLVSVQLLPAPISAMSSRASSLRCWHSPRSGCSPGCWSSFWSRPG
jgi:hypothetical protein